MITLARLVKNAELKGIEIYFDAMPSEEIRNDMKSLGFRWHRAKKCWYAKETADRLNLANKLCATPDSNKTTKKAQVTPKLVSQTDFTKEIMHRKCCYAATLEDFLLEDEVSWLSKMKSAFSDAYLLSLGSSQINAWVDSFRVLKKHLTILSEDYSEFNIIFEYALPYESGRRPDVLLVYKEYVIILEFKMKDEIHQADVDQVSAYARDIYEYHYESREKQIIPILVLTKGKDIHTHQNSTNKCNAVICISKEWLYNDLFRIICDSGNVVSQCDVNAWLNSKYEPLPTIVEAARMFMKKEELPNIRRVNSTGIPIAMDYLKKLTKRVKDNRELAIVFVTGVPGAGKTFLGLQYVYDICEKDGEVNSVYLSGNGPLVKVMTNALNSNVFVKDLHKVENEFLRSKSPDFNSNVIVFDEGQRAWDKAQMQSKKRGFRSEPEVMIDLVETCLDWGVLLILVGEGQEIYKGENSGIEQWNDALSNTACDWTIVCPSKLSNVFKDQPNIEIEDSLDLTVSLRTHLAGDVSKFVNNFIEGNLIEAKKYLNSIYDAGFTMFVTRNLQDAKDYCKERYEGQFSKRYGMVASSKSKSGVRAAFRPDVAAWFNALPSENGSSCKLNIAISEFDCQGLELDMPIVCWGNDMTWNGKSWNLFNPAEDASSDDNTYRKNSYRVLMTRGRDGFIVHIPNTTAYDKIYRLFIDTGIKEL